MKAYFVCCLVVLSCVVSPWAAGASARTAGQELTPEQLATLTFEQKRGSVVPLDMDLTDSRGQAVRLGSLLQDKPAILVMADYECLHLCSVVLNATLESARQMKMICGKDYQVLVVSIRPDERWETARDRQHTYSTRYGRGEQGWYFLVQRQTAVRELADALGFHYAYDPSTKQFAHPSGITILTPQGKVSRYFFGIEYPPKDVQDALREASQSRLGPIAQKLFLLCFHYDPTTGKYGLIISRVITVSCLATAFGLFFLIWRMRRQEPVQPVTS